MTYFKSRGHPEIMNNIRIALPMFMSLLQIVLLVAKFVHESPKYTMQMDDIDAVPPPNPSATLSWSPCTPTAASAARNSSSTNWEGRR